MKTCIAISMGDYNGIGPEVILKALNTTKLSNWTPIIMGNETIFTFYASKIGFTQPFHPIQKPDDIKEGAINILNVVNVTESSIQPGKCNQQAGRCAMEAVNKGIQWCLQEHAQGLVTAPISKEAINKAGYTVPGHTEFLAKKTNTANYMMLLVHDELRVGLVSIHIPVAQIAKSITGPKILQHIETMHLALKNDFNIGNPRIAVLGLNPHAGDGGVIGHEEVEMIQPTMETAQQNGLNVEGPFPADGFFGNRAYTQYDGILAMYHDQGLVPFKTLSFGGGVNVTAGLPIVRTSPDHGTAFNIAGQGKADPSSFN